MCADRLHFVRPRHGGFTLLELLMFIVIMSVGFVAVLYIFNVTVRGSADPLQRKQALAVAESLLDEAMQQAFTFCAPGDANVLTATVSTAAACASAANVMDTPANWGVGKSRYASPFFDNVADYHGLTMNGSILDVNGNVVLTGYSAQISVAQVGASFGVAAGDVLRVQAMACAGSSVNACQGRSTVNLSGFRFRHSPNSPG